MICADGLTGMKEAVNAAFPQTELQRCIVHQVRNTLKYVGEKNKKEFANDLKTIYQAPSEEATGYQPDSIPLRSIPLFLQSPAYSVKNKTDSA